MKKIFGSNEQLNQVKKLFGRSPGMNTSEIINTTESDMASPYKSSAQKGTPSKIKEI